MVVVQFAILTGLIVATITIYRQTHLAIGSALGAGHGPVLTMAVNCRTGFPQAARELPGVRDATCVSVGAINMGPQGAVTAINRNGQRFTPGFVDVDPHFLGVIGLKPLAGRGFSPDRTADTSRREVVLNQTAVRHFGFASPHTAIGQPIGISLEVGKNPATKPYTIIGVVPDAPASVLTPAGELIYNAGSPEAGILAVEASPDALRAVRRRLDRLWRELGDGGPLEPRLLSQIEYDRYRTTVTQGWVIGACALVALVIAAMGLFALSAFTADRRTKEIGIRRAMGASTAAIVHLLLWQFYKPFLLACVIGIPLSYIVMRHWLEQFASRVDLPLWQLGAVILITGMFATMAMLTHVLAAARARPVDALRHE
jgi:putative ABC transport system permease protein